MFRFIVYLFQVFCFILAGASAAPLSPELIDDLKWKSVDFDKDGKPDVVPLTPLTPEFNNDLQWKSVDRNKDGQPDVTAVVEEAKVADTPIAEVPSVEAKMAPLGYAININVGSIVEAAPEPIVQAVPVAEVAKVVDNVPEVVPVVVASAVEAGAPIVEVDSVADSVNVQAASAVEVAAVAEETKVVDATPVVPVADTPVVVEAGTSPEVELKSPEPVEDTPEIQEAKAVFFRLYEEAATAAAAVDEDGNPTVNNDLSATERKTRQIVSYFNPSIVQQPAFFPATYPFTYRAGFPYTFPIVYPTVPTPVTAKNDRKKRQIPVLSSSQLYNDLIYKSVDVDQDGQPDKAVIATPQTFPYLPYTGYPYSAYYPHAYSFANGLHF